MSSALVSPRIPYCFPRALSCPRVMSWRSDSGTEDPPNVPMGAGAAGAAGAEGGGGVQAGAAEKEGAAAGGPLEAELHGKQGT